MAFRIPKELVGIHHSTSQLMFNNLGNKPPEVYSRQTRDSKKLRDISYRHPLYGLKEKSFSKKTKIQVEIKVSPSLSFRLVV